MKQSDFESKLNKSFDYLIENLNSLRTSGANMSLIDNIKVEAYVGSAPLTIMELGNISTVGFDMLVIELWDVSIVDKVAEALRNSSAKLNPVIEGKILRVPIPKLTEERRKEYVKVVGQKIEQAKIAIRNIRQDALGALEEQKENNIISEDEYFRIKKQFEEAVKEINEKIGQKGKEKEAEILEIKN